jgi:acetylornithine deacetylase/succinyl-diaminopimelate desuccinylase-like protein
MVDQELAKKVLAQIDRDEIAQLGCALTDIPSPTGQEKAVSDFVVGWFKANGIKGISQEIAPGRPNAVGVVKGDGSGLSLQFNGHLDTSYVGGREDFRILHESEAEPDEMMRGSIVGDEVHGLGIGNMKCGVASIMMAGKAIVKAGVKLKGDLVLAGTVGEISRTPINEFQGQEYRGEGVGTRHLVTHGFHTDYAVCCDGSDMNIVWAQNGVVQMKVTVFGKPEAAWGSDRSKAKMDELNAIIKMTKVIGAIERWAEGFEQRYVYQSQTGPILPKVNVGAIQGGAPYRPNYYPGWCSIYVDVRIPPKVRPVTVKYEMEQTLNELGMRYELDVYKALLGHEGVNVEPLVEAANEGNKFLWGKPIAHEGSARASIWTDTNIYNELGIPSVKIGPRGFRIGPRAEAVKIDEMVKGAQLYALMILDICMRDRNAPR